MPNCFQLIDKTTNKPEFFNVIDDKICAHFGVKPDEKYYFIGWYDIIGLGLAMGNSLAKLRERYTRYIRKGIEENYDTRIEEKLVKITFFLEANYTSSAWAEFGKR